MRLHYIGITAFGPFPGTQEVDFDALCEPGLFLIHGPTGAGKTSVLDAVCFALYGHVPSARDAAKSLRSDHAAPGARPEVVLDVTIRGRRLRITRSPAWRRPKRRGTGHTEEKARAIVEERVADGWVARATRLDEAGHFIGGLLGMSADQFFQVVLLPQGDFARFLSATAEERRKLLEKLFATEVFTEVEKWLTDRAQQTGRQVADAVRAAEEIADRAAETASVADRPALDPDGLAGWTTEVGRQLAEALPGVEDLARDAGRALTLARADDERARTLADRRGRYADARRRAEALAGRAAERAALRATLDSAAGAGRVLPLIRAVAARTEAAARTSAASGGAFEALAGLVADTSEPDILRKEERARRDEIAGLEQLRGDAARLTEITGEEARAAAALDARTQDEAALAAALVELPVRQDAIRADLLAAREAEAALPGARAEVADIERRLAAARERDDLNDRLGAAEDRHRAAVDVAQEARGLLLELRRLRIEGMAATLARDLEPGEPCRVCGATDHPAPADPGGGLPGEEDLEAAELADGIAHEEREDTAAAVAGLRAALDAEIANAGDAEVESLETDLAGSRQRLSELSSLAGCTESLSDRLEVVGADVRQARERREDAAQAITEARVLRRELADEAGRIRAKLDKARGADATVPARIDRLSGEAELIGVAAGALEADRRAAAELRLARDEAESAAAREGFGDAAAAAAAALSADDLAALRGRLRRFDDEEAAVAELLADPDLRAAAAEPEPDLGGAARRFAAAEERRTELRSALDRGRDRRDRLAELAAELTAAAARWWPLADRHDVASALAELVRGTSADNRLRMKLSAYVLAARLEQVVASANDRLARMSGGRYALEHSVEKTAGDRTRSGGGLGLRIADTWTGVSRDPATLSGGESFVTSLALALGLADVVTAEAGGAEIGALFVDEGFGTLDEDTLDEVMTILDGLRDGGRAVGVVSHVAELRSRIPARLRVHKTRSGSELTVTCGQDIGAPGCRDL